MPAGPGAPSPLAALVVALLGTATIMISAIMPWTTVLAVGGIVPAMRPRAPMPWAPGP